MNDFLKEKKDINYWHSHSLFFYPCTLKTSQISASVSHVFYSTGDENLVFNVQSLFYLLIISRLLTTFIFQQCYFKPTSRRNCFLPPYLSLSGDNLINLIVFPAVPAHTENFSDTSLLNNFSFT